MSKADTVIQQIKQLGNEALLTQLYAMDGEEDPKIYIGIGALQGISEELGQEGLIAFAKWAVDKHNGFHAQDLSVKPLPPEVQKVFSDMADTANEIIRGGKDQPPPEVRWIPRMDRREFLRRAGFGVFGAAAGGGIGEMITSPEYRIYTIAMMALLGGGLTATLGHNAHKVREALEEEESEVDDPESLVTLDEIATAATYTLQQCLNRRKDRPMAL